MFTVVIVVVSALILSAFFSGMEIAFVTSNRLRLEIDKKQSRTFSYIIDLFTRRPGQYITTILVGNNIALVVYSLNMSTLLTAAAHHFGWVPGSESIIVETLISTVIIIFTAEFIPKAVVKSDPNFYMKAFAVPVYFFYLLLYPIAKLTTWISVAFLKLVGLPVRRNQTIHTFDRVDLEHLVEEATDGEKEDGHDHKGENEFRLFQNALDFPDQRVRDCMVPRVDIEAAEVTETIGELTGRFVESQYSRIFIYEDSIDNIIGYVNTKSLFTNPKSVREVMKPVTYVTESMPAQKLLTDFIKKKQSVAVVIDEFGGTAGMVSLEDVLEEIFGEIEDEHDSQDLIEKQVSEKEWIFSCRLEVRYLNEKYGLEIPESDEYDTLAGYIIFHYEGIPPQGETLSIENKEIKILRKSSSRLELARVRLTE